MIDNARAEAPRLDGYYWQTQYPLHCMVFVLPMMLFFHLGGGYSLGSLKAVVDLSRILRFFGGTAAYLTPVAIIAVLLAQHLVRRDPWGIHPKVLLGMLIESMAFVIPLVAIGHLANKLAALAANTAAAAQTDGVFREILKGTGAGIYEEFLFRLLAISLAMLIFVDVFVLKKGWVAVGTVIVTAVLFAMYHVGGDFVFRTLAGVYLGGLFLLRGFGVAVGTHVMWNIYYALLLLAGNPHA